MSEVEFDPVLGEVRRGREAVTLRPKTSQLLAFLIERRANPVSKEDLIAHVWEGAAITDATIVGCVQELRKILGDNAKEPAYIKTIAKRGYWFVGPVQEITIDSRHVEPPKRRPRALIWGLAAAAIAGALAVWALARPTPRSKWEAAWWTFDETGDSIAEKISGSTARLPAGVGRVDGVSGRALHFSGRDVVVEGPLDTLPRDDESRTMLAWIRTTETTGDSSVVFHYGSPEPDVKDAGFYLLLDPFGAVRFGGVQEAIARKRVTDGQWHQIAGVFDSESRTATMFVDGVPDGKTVFAPGRLKTASAHPHWTIGRLAWGGTAFRGDIDDVRVYARSLRPAEIQSVYSCMSASADLEIPGRGQFYFSPVHGAGASMERLAEGETSARVRNTSTEYSGITFVKREPGCALQNAWATPIGQNLEVETDLKVGSLPGMAAGPYFRSRRSAPGDGIVGGTSAGFWVQLGSTGQVLVKRLHPLAIIAFSAAPQGFDPAQFHRLRILARGETLTVTLDGHPQQFDQSGTFSETVRLSPAWETARPIGTNHGAAGIAFSPEETRSIFGGQEARNIKVRMLE
jgi:DNA-binding winged helix-turn-helix (wHTH) protein